MKKVLPLLLLLLSYCLNAQTEEKSKSFPNENSAYLTFDLTTIVSPFAPRYRLGYIQSINKNWRIGVDLGYGQENIIFNTSNSNSRMDNYSLFEIRSEIYHIFNPSKRLNHYISGELYYIYHEEDFYNTHYHLDARDEQVFFDEAHFIREKIGFNLKYGAMFPFGEKVGMNVYIGIGPRLKNITYKDVVNPSVQNDYDDHDWFSERRTEGSRFGVSTTLGVKFFYRIN
ncbi:hypothetical protein [Ulvibacter antarcticus]|uniref:DUF3575 domain-containing protein n=1 Tax=Ulvibacter antarcticus TaxID=442714 RepID=A0A3L9YH87_9FLAO|nr:hypothetical protein [Ulvibacter antarcticus]RMA58549.1 hypothetical protein BXY75_1922 [Ulvibacter antarcticus]